MKVCPKCFLQYDDNENFCFNDGITLDVLSGSQEQVTVTIPVASNQTVKCRQCETENKVSSKFCKKCGITFTPNEPIFIPLHNSSSNQQETVVISTAPKVETQNFTAYPPLSQNPIIQTDNTTKYILGGLGGLIALIFFGVFLYPSNKTKESEDKSNKTTSEKSSKTEGNNSVSKNSSNLPNSFERDYRGTISTKDCSMSLTRDGEKLSGTIATDRHQDTLKGKIDEYGEFQLNGYEDGNVFTGIYTGRINDDGNIEGSWTTPQGTKPRSFSLTQQ